MYVGEILLGCIFFCFLAEAMAMVTMTGTQLAEERREPSSILWGFVGGFFNGIICMVYVGNCPQPVTVPKKG